MGFVKGFWSRLVYGKQNIDACRVPNVYLKQVCVKNILSFKDVEFPLDRYTVIVGPNNSGKTNLLRILEMVAEEMSFEYFSLDTKHKMDPDEPSEMALTLALDESRGKDGFRVHVWQGRRR